MGRKNFSNLDKLKEKAKKLDLDDSLSKFRDKFIIPKDKIYFDGNSLGLLPKKTIDEVNNVVKNEWGNNLISSWNNKWIELPRIISSKIAKIINSKTDEIYVGSSTSNNLYKLIKSILMSHNGIKSISTDNLNFPSDKYICEGISNDFNIKYNLLNYETDLLPDIDLLKRFILDHKGIIVLSHVSYKSSYKYPMSDISKFCNKNNIFLIWDLSHSIGAVNIDMDLNYANYAVGCTYKYLNGGPGSPAFIYVRKSKIKKLKSPIKGWFSHSKPFNFSNKYEESNSINKFSNGTPHIISLSSLKTSLDITIDASTKKLHLKSTNLFILFNSFYIDNLKDLGFNLLTPINIEERGSHISISHEEALRISKCLISPIKRNKIKIIVDYRPKNIIRIALTPLYITFNDIHLLCKRLIEITTTKEYVNKDSTSFGVT
tara:strand:+ start:4859 stop:6151 length:1293 start_codon:yes stop_codon:yes gene_type:complete